MKRNLRLSNYDMRFLENLEDKFIAKNIPITTNQVTLLHKIVGVYSRQFAAQGMRADTLINLPWSVAIIASDGALTNASISVVNDTIVFTSPFNSTFLNTMVRTPDNYFVWDKERKCHTAPFGLYSLKMILSLSRKYWPKIRCCAVTTQILDELKKFDDVPYWNPTLKRVNGNLMIVAANGALIDGIADIPLNTEVSTIANLVRYGIAIDNALLGEIADNSSDATFVSQYTVDVEMSKVLFLVTWLSKIGCDAVFMNFGLNAERSRTDLATMLRNTGIRCYDLGNLVRDANHAKFKFPVVIRWRSYVDVTHEPIKIAKIIYMKNSHPVTL